jgi:FAD/FMN-containing dehydrogenase
MERPVRLRAASARPAGHCVNDVHSRLNPTTVAEIVRPSTIDDLRIAILRARDAGLPVAIAGGQHSMGGQQFASDAMLIDTRSLDRVLAFDDERGLLTVEAGIQWPAVAAYLDRAAMAGRPHGAAYLDGAASARQARWGIVQKQTGADRLCLGGALSCNAHGRGLRLKPIVQQVEEFDLMDGDGCVRTCSRTVNPDLFRLAIGGYGMFGVITRVVLRLQPAVKVRRVVELRGTGGLTDAFERRIRDGFLYGDFQFAIDAGDESFLRRGVFSCYEPVDATTPLTEEPVRFTPAEWQRLVLDAHVNKHRAFEIYSTRYLASSGQIYRVDAQLTTPYLDNYHEAVDLACGAVVPGSEMITEVYVPRTTLTEFMEAARAELRRHEANVIYGTIRLIERDDETFLPWARDRYACVVFNLHVDHTTEAISRAAETFRALIDLAIARGGSFYLAYHRWARRDQIEACYPQMREWLVQKRLHDPDERFQSDWYRHLRELFA